MGLGIAAPTRVSLGENSRLLIGGLIGSAESGIWIRFVQGTADVNPAEGDATDNMSGGFTEPTRGPRTCRVTADCLWRSADNPIGNLPNLSPGDLMPRCIFWPDMDNAPGQYIKLPSAFCSGFTITAAGTADIRFTMGVRNDGYFYWPGKPDPKGVFG